MRKLVAVISFGLFGFAGLAQASLIGDTVTAEVQFGGVTAQGPANALVVDPGVEFDFGNVDIDVFDASASFFNILGGSVTLDETYLLTDLDWVGQAGEIVGVLSSSFGGLSIAPVIVTGPHSLSVTLPGSTFVGSGAFVNVALDVVHVPEPASLALLGLGLAALGFSRRKKPH